MPCVSGLISLIDFLCRPWDKDRFMAPDIEAATGLIINNKVGLSIINRKRISTWLAGYVQASPPFSCLVCFEAVVPFVLVIPRAQCTAAVEFSCTDLHFLWGTKFCFVRWFCRLLPAGFLSTPLLVSHLSAKNSFLGVCRYPSLPIWPWSRATQSLSSDATLGAFWVISMKNVSCTDFSCSGPENLYIEFTARYCETKRKVTQIRVVPMWIVRTVQAILRNSIRCADHHIVAT